jgi:hypothetical protein
VGIPHSGKVQRLGISSHLSNPFAFGTRHLMDAMTLTMTTLCPMTLSITITDVRLGITAFNTYDECRYVECH